mgnify:CR=1 FL=1
MKNIFPLRALCLKDRGAPCPKGKDILRPTRHPISTNPSGIAAIRNLTNPVSLADFDRGPEEKLTSQEKWISLLKSSGHLSEMPSLYRDDGAVSTFFAALERARFTKDEERRYVKDMMTKWDIENSKREVAAKLSKPGVPIETIAKGTGLPAKEIEKL